MNISDNKKTDRLLQFILATAGQEDCESRELGEIHLIKYLYLADLDYAIHSNGMTYTNLPWKFHHFGPWSSEAYLRIEPALQAVGAKKRIIRLERPKYENDFIRWSVISDTLYNRLERELPLIITSSVQKYVHRFNAITEDLLDFVYKTWPMLRSEPEEMLDFTIPDYIRKQPSDSANNISGNLSARQKKKKKQAVEAFKAEFRKKLESKKRKPKLRFCPRPSLYDDIYFEGLRTLDALAGEEIKMTQGIVRFSDDIWKSKARFDPDVP